MHCALVPLTYLSRTDRKYASIAIKLKGNVRTLFVLSAKGTPSQASRYDYDIDVVVT